jgi:hypothetical protein
MLGPSRRTWVCLIAVTVAVGVAQLSGASTSRGAAAGPLGASAMVSALVALPPVADLPPSVLFGIERASAAIGGDVDEARTSLRRLRQRFGSSAVEALYGFRIGRRSA